MVLCPKCGKLSMVQTTFDVGGLVCRKCGSKCVHETVANEEDLTSVTSAVRSYTASASQSEKTKKYGQQKWGLFETNYQRNKGITTEESLQEIEDFAKSGPRGLNQSASSYVSHGPRGLNQSASSYVSHASEKQSEGPPKTPPQSTYNTHPGFRTNTVASGAASILAPPSNGKKKDLPPPKFGNYAPGANAFFSQVQNNSRSAPKKFF